MIPKVMPLSESYRTVLVNKR